MSSTLALKVAQQLHKFTKSYGFTTDKDMLKHDLIHAVCNLDTSLQGEVTVFFLQRGYFPDKDKAMKIANQLSNFNKIVNDFDYFQLKDKWSTYKVKVDHLSNELVAQVAIILNVK
jgi:hypothetical protein